MIAKVILSLPAAWLLLAALALSQVRAEPDSEVPGGAELVEDQRGDLSQDQLESIIKEFGAEIQETMQEEMKKFIGEAESSAQKGGAQVNQDELEKLKEAEKTISEDTRRRIELAATQNDGQFTRASAKDAPVQGSFLNQVSQKLRATGNFVGQQMSSLTALAPKIKNKLKTVPGKLRKLMRWPSFLRYKIQFNKVYKSLREELYRQMVYLRTQTIVGIQSLKYLAGQQTYLLKATEFADLTEKEHQAMHANAERDTGDELAKASLGASDKEHLKQLLAEGKNIFGQDMGAALEQNSKQQAAKQAGARRRRRKRSVFGASHNELDDEEMEDYDEDEPMEEEEQLSNELDGYSVAVDDYAAEFSEDADMSAINDLDNLMDEALGDDGKQYAGVDLRQTGCIGTPENQNGCGACYAYATTLAASYFNCMGQEPRKLERYHSRFISDCGRYMWEEGKPIHLEGCKSGKLSYALAFARQAGTYTFMKYHVAHVNFDFSSDKCAYPRPDSIQEWAPVQIPWFKRTSLVYLTSLSEVDIHLRTIGPVFVNVLTWKNFKDQGYGVYGGLEDSENPIIHSMVIVGHDKDQNGRDYYLIWNSFGVAWAEHGFVRIYEESLEHFKLFYAGYLDTSNLK